jgi:NTE family protein
MIHSKNILFFLLFLTFSVYTFSQSGWIKIPLGYEEIPTGRNSYIPYFQEKRPKIALALSGGGARGLAHIGVLKVLEKYGLPVDGIAGTSMGAIVGSLAAVGYSASEIDSIARHIDWDEIIKDAPPRRQLFLGQKEQKSRAILQIRFEKLSLDFRPAYTSGQKLTTILTDILLKAPSPFTSDFHSLNIPIKILTTDLLSGEKIVFDRGSLVDALRATLAIPLLFTPLETDSAMLVDGGLIDNLPVEEARQLPADLVIAVDTSSKLRSRKSLAAPWEIADQVTTIMQQNQILSQMQKADVVIQPMLNDVSNTNFGHIDATIRAGEEAAEKAIPKIESLLSSKWKQQDDPSYNIRQCAFVGLDKFSFGSEGASFRTPKMGRLYLSEIVCAGRSLYQTGYFQNISLKLDTLNSLLVFQTKENPFIEKIEFIGNSVFPDSALLQDINTRPGTILNIFKGIQDLKTITAKYHQKGFSLARVEKTEIVNNTLVIHINEGRISAIRFHGNHRTKPFAIQREIPIKEGTLFNVALFKQGIENVYSTGYFKSLRFFLDKRDSDYILNFNLTEQGFTLLRAGLRYDSERRTQSFLETVEENLFGVGAEGSLTGVIGSKDRMFKATVRTDQIFKTLLTAQFFFCAASQDYNYYESYKKTGWYRLNNLQTILSVGQQMRRLGTLSFQLRNERIRVKPEQGSNTPRESFLSRNFVIHSEVDSRDRIPFSNSGKYHIFEYETSTRFLGGDISYSRMYSSMESFFPMPYGVVLRPRIRWGTADLTTPFAKQFKFGGIESFLGLPEEAMIGRQFIILSGEARVKIPYPHWLESYISVRYDLGSGWSQYVQIQAKDFRQGYGLILSVNTPFGPIQTGVGKIDGGKSRFYLSAGYRF